MTPRSARPALARTGLALAGLLLAAPLAGALLACDRGAPPEEALADASTEVTFTSVEQIGPHHMVASIVRTDARANGDQRVVDELVEISWQDWDDFHVRRLVDGQVERETIVAGGVPYVSVADRFEQRDDAEPHRVQLRTTWNMWDAVLGAHLDHVQLEPTGKDIVEGRPARVYSLQMKPDEERPKNKRWGFIPEAASGTVWLDEGTAVRLKAQIELTSRRDGVLRTVKLDLQRSNIGMDQGVAPPP